MRRLLLLLGVLVVSIAATAAAVRGDTVVAPGGGTPGTAKHFRLVGHDPLFARGMNAALALYDTRVHAEPPDYALQLVDATALLWRLHLEGLDLDLTELNEAFVAELIASIERVQLDTARTIARLPAECRGVPCFRDAIPAPDPDLLGKLPPDSYVVAPVPKDVAALFGIPNPKLLFDFAYLETYRPKGIDKDGDVIGVVPGDDPADANRHSAKFYRWVNEIPTLLVIGSVILVIGKPF